SATRRARRSVSATVSPSRAMRRESSSPSSHSMAMYASPAWVVPCATYFTIPGCRSSERTRASRAKRSRLSLHAPWRTLRAIIVPVVGSGALNPGAMPPGLGRDSTSNRSGTGSAGCMQGHQYIGLKWPPMLFFVDLALLALLAAYGLHRAHLLALYLVMRNK